jgi:hypothetical protein
VGSEHATTERSGKQPDGIGGVNSRTEDVVKIGSQPVEWTAQ